MLAFKALVLALVLVAALGCGPSMAQMLAEPTFTPTIPRPTPTPTPRTGSGMFIVDPLSRNYLSFQLEPANRVEAYVTIQGGRSDVDVWIQDPFGNKVQELGRVTVARGFAFTASTVGEHRVYFDNSFSLLTNKVVTWEAAVHWR